MFYINNLDTVTRYDTIKFFNFDVDNIDCLTSYMLKILKTLPVQGSYTLLNEDARPDLLSYHIYKDTQYWWLLLAYNSILDINDLKPRLIVQYPSLDNIEDVYLSASRYRKVS